MAVTKKVNLKLKKGLHPPDVIRLQISGPGAAKIQIDELKKRLVKAANERFNLSKPVTAKDFVSHYRLQEPYQIFLRVHGQASLQPKDLYGQVFTSPGAGLAEIRVSHPKYDETRIFLNFCPPELNEDQETIKQVTDEVLPPDTAHHSVFRRVQGREDRNLILAAIPKESIKEIPHYLEYEVDGTTKYITVTIPGRMPLCPNCEKEVHTGNDCPKMVKKKSEKQKTSTTTANTQTDERPKAINITANTQTDEQPKTADFATQTEISETTETSDSEGAQPVSEVITPHARRPRPEPVTSELPLSKQQRYDYQRQKPPQQQERLTFEEFKSWGPTYSSIHVERIGEAIVARPVSQTLYGLADTMVDSDPAGTVYHSTRGRYKNSTIFWLKKNIDEQGNSFFAVPTEEEVMNSTLWKSTMTLGSKPPLNYCQDS